jgi:hypothetical protein
MAKLPAVTGLAGINLDRLSIQNFGVKDLDTAKLKDLMRFHPAHTRLCNSGGERKYDRKRVGPWQYLARLVDTPLALPKGSRSINERYSSEIVSVMRQDYHRSIEKRRAAVSCWYFDSIYSTKAIRVQDDTSWRVCHFGEKGSSRQAPSPTW